MCAYTLQPTSHNLFMAASLLQAQAVGFVRRLLGFHMPLFCARPLTRCLVKRNCFNPSYALESHSTHE